MDGKIDLPEFCGENFFDIVQRFYTLKVTLFPSTIKQEKDKNTMSPKEFEAHLRQVDKRLLLYCIAGLMTGKYECNLQR